MKNYCIVPIFWGATFFLAPDDKNFPSTPYTREQLTDALKAVNASGYFSSLGQYGCGKVSVNPPTLFGDPWPAGDAYYIAKFTNEDVIGFIQRHIASLQVPPDLVPIYCVVIPNGSLLDVSAVGAHSVFQFDGKDRIWFWMYGTSKLNDAVLVLTHEIVEAIGADGKAPKELCDDCAKESPGGIATVNGLTVASYFDAITNSCVAPGSTWLELDNNRDSAGIVADGVNLYQLHRTGRIWIYTGTPHSGWTELDNNGDTLKIAASGGNLYQIHKTGKIWKYTGTPHTGWLELDNNGDSVDIVADGQTLYQLHRTGRIWVYTGTPHTGWTELDNNGDTLKIAASGGNLYQIHKTGKIWKYTGTPHTGWLELDNNGDSVDIVADGQTLYQLHRTGRIWVYTGTPHTGWLELDNNGDTQKIAAGNGNLYQIHKTGMIWKYTGTPHTGWLLIDANPDSVGIASGSDSVYQIHRTGRIWSHPA